MDKTTYENWVKVKEALEAAGKTDSFFYKRAVYIVQNRRDLSPGI